MQHAHQEVMENWTRQDWPAPPIGDRAATGEVIVGKSGRAEHAEYTVISSSVNLVSRTLKGFSEPQPVWRVLKLRG